MLQNKKVPYHINGTSFEGYLAWDDSLKYPVPGILVAHAWRGQDRFAREKADQLAQMGYIGFAADVYGKGKEVYNNQEAASLMLPLFEDRKELRNRIQAALIAMSGELIVDRNRLGAVGFCFGGLTVLELLRSGAPVKGVVSFHGLMGEDMGGIHAKRPPNAEKISGSILFLHGNDDPLVSKEDIASLQKELTDAKVDWQMNIYGHAAHAFSNPEAHEVEMGLIYHARTASRAWKEMVRFFEEIFEIKE